MVPEKQVAAVCFLVGLKTGAIQSLVQKLLKSFADLRLPSAGLIHVAHLYRPDVSRDFDDRFRFIGAADAFEGVRDARRAHPPLDEQTVGLHPAMKNAAAIDPINIGAIPPHDAAEFDDVEIGVARLQWVERPCDERDARFERVVALRQLQPYADAGVLKSRLDREQLRIVIRPQLFIEGRERVRHAHQLGRGVKRAQSEPAGVTRGYVQAQWHYVEVRIFPDSALHLNARFEFFESLALANCIFGNDHVRFHIFLILLASPSAVKPDRETEGRRDRRDGGTCVFSLSLRLYVSEFYGFGILIVLLTIRQPEMKKSATGQ